MNTEYENYSPISEKELHEIIKHNLKSLEKGLVLLEYEKSLPKGIPDFLCMDSGNRLVIIEVKLHQDENILFQALRYYGDVNKNRNVIANSFKDKTIDPKQNPRIILIAESISDDIRELATLVTPDIELYAFQAIEFKDHEKGIVYFSVSMPRLANEEIPELPKIEGHYDYLKNEELKQVIDNIRQEITQIDKAIDEYVTHSYIGFKYRGKVIASISVQRQSFDLTATIIDDKGNVVENYTQRINSRTENYKDTINKTKESYFKISQLKNK